MTKQFSEMTGPELVAAFNAMVTTNGLEPDVKTVKKFSDHKTGVRRCESLAATLAMDEVREAEVVAETPDVPTVPEAPQTMLDAHVAEMEARGATVGKLGVETSPAEIVSETSKGQLMTVVRKDGTLAHTWMNEARAKALGESAKAPRKSARAELKITALVPANPKKPGSDGARHFEGMAGKMVGEYLAGFAEGKARRTANQWLGNFVREGLVKIG